MAQSGKPPIEIEENKSKKTPGTLTYTEERGSTHSGGGLSMGKIFVMLIVVLGAAILISSYLAKNDAKILENSINQVQSIAKKAADDLAGQIKRIDNIVNAQGEFAKKTEISSKADKSELSSYAKSSDLSGYATSKALADYKSQTDAVVADLKAKIVALEEELETRTPVITSFTPTSGAVGTSVVITGTYFLDSSAVSFGGTPAQSFTVNSATQVTAIVGNGSTGSVSVTTPDGTVTSTGTFTYTGITIPTVSAFTPMSGGTGTSVVITGTNFSGITSVTFGGTPAQSFIVNSTTQITAIVGSGSTGVVGVQSTTGAGYSTSTFSFTTGGGQVGSVTATIVGGPTMSLVQTGTTISVTIQNNSGKAIFAEQLSLAFQFFSATSTNPVNGWGLQLTGITGPTYSPNPGYVSYVWNASAYILSGQSYTISTVLTGAPTVSPSYPQNFQVTTSVTGYSSL